MKIILSILLLNSLSAFAGEAFNVTCYAPNAEHVSIRKFEIENFSGILSEDPYRDGANLIDRDAGQNDPVRMMGEHLIELDLNNGCDNSYEFLFSKVDYQDLLKGTKNQIQVRLDYFFVADFEDEADEEGITEGHLNATCIKTKPQSTELGPTF